MAKIEWTDVSEVSPWKVPTFSGRIGLLHVADVREAREGEGWWVTVHLKPLPDRLEDMTLEPKVSQRQAQATAQRVVNAFTRLLTGDA